MLMSHVLQLKKSKFQKDVSCPKVTNQCVVRTGFKPKAAWLGAHAASVRPSEEARPATGLLLQVTLIFKISCTEDLTSSTPPHGWQMSKI